MNFFKALILLFVMTSCTQKEKADLIVSGASVYTVDEEFTVAESFAVKNGKIVAVGTSQEINDKYDSDNIINAEGKFIYPGFNDAHCHFNGYAINLLQYADLRGTKSQDEIYELLKAHHDKFGGEWILGRSWDQNDWEDTRFPDKAKLDELFPDIPVYLVRVDGHAGWCNSKALELAGISANSKVQGGEVLLKNGEPTGVLIDNAMGFVGKLIPEMTAAQQEKGLLEAQKNCFAAGLTSVTDCGLDKATILLMDELQEAGTLKMRVNAMLNPTQENFDYFVKKGEAYKTDRLLVNTIKVYADGALGSRGALLMEDYSDDEGNSGLQIETQDYYDMICQLAYDNNFVVATHAIGDGGNRLMLDTYGRFLKGKNDRRWRIEHSQIVNPDDFKKFAEFSIVPSIQPTHCTSDMPWAEDRLGPERIKGAYAYQTLLKQIGWVPAGTDFPVEDIYPLYTFYSAVFRADHEGWPEGGWHKDEGLTREQTLRAMTSWAAKSSFEEDEKGQLVPGMWADFVVLDTDLMKAEPKEVLNTKILSTWSAGEKVFEL
ncbi:amidohydrolase [Draconibacterium sediminis]|uniref:Amidohydrolase n=1 Tax=Draconibacterium sediminis TaxID=1544798 RepID=A0A0D8JEE1_9BACT|nr:amidohydrolase [Draconibacterium sediminis]KJF44193.1 amidohydrolase [Draconibacterium sediminis]